MRASEVPPQRLASNSSRRNRHYRSLDSQILEALVEVATFGLKENSSKSSTKRKIGPSSLKPESQTHANYVVIVRGTFLPSEELSKSDLAELFGHQESSSILKVHCSAQFKF